MVDHTEYLKAWLQKAQSDIGIAELAINNGMRFPDIICFHCQQYAEKMIKAKLIFYGVNPPRIHGLAALLDILSDYETVDENLYDRASTLEEYAVGVRYPGQYGMPTVADAKDAYNVALDIAQAMMAGMNDLI